MRLIRKICCKFQVIKINKLYKIIMSDIKVEKYKSVDQADSLLRLALRGRGRRCTVTLHDRSVDIIQRRRGDGPDRRPTSSTASSQPRTARCLGYRFCLDRGRNSIASSGPPDRTERCTESTPGDLHQSKLPPPISNASAGPHPYICSPLTLVGLLNCYAFSL